MKISDIIQRRRGTAGGGAWRVVTTNSGNELWHYSTRMLTWTDTPSGVEILQHSTGWGSVSDQNGMNTAFRVLRAPYRYDRDARGGGPRITETKQ